MRHLDMPWNVTHGDHLLEHPARMLRTLRRSRANQPLHPVIRGHLDDWLTALTVHGLVVGYAPRHGFFYVPRHPSDPDSHPIRPEPLTDLTHALRRLPDQSTGHAAAA